MTPEFTYFIDGTQVYPGGDWKIRVAKASEDFVYCRDYRIKFDGELAFRGNDYDLITSKSCCEEIEFLVKCEGVDYFTGYFTYPNSFKIDEDTCTVYGTPGTEDKYKKFDLNYKESGTPPILGTYVVNWETNICTDVWLVNNRTVESWWLITSYYSQLASGSVGLPNICVSTFFQNDTFPDGTNPYPEINYATGYANKLRNIGWETTEYIGNLTANTTRPTWSLEDVARINHDLFNAWWYVDEQGQIRWEHIYFWDLYFGNSYDLTTLDSGRWTINTSKFRYKEEEMPFREFWLVNDTLRNKNDFFSQPIGYPCGQWSNISPQEIEYSQTDYVADIEFVWTTALSLNGWMLLRLVGPAVVAGEGKTLPGGCTHAVWFSTGVVSGVDRQNGHLSMANLLYNYHTYDRPFTEGDTQFGNDFVFNTAAQNKIQEELAFPVCCLEETDFDPTYDTRDRKEFGFDFLEFIVSQYGAGIIDTGWFSSDGMFHVELAFENDCNSGDPTSLSGDSEF